MRRNPAPIGLVLLGVAVAAVSVPIYTVARWITVRDDLQPYDAMVDAFMAGFPSWLASPRAVTWVALGLATLAVAAGSAARRLLTGGWRVMVLAVVVLAGLLAMWHLFTLM